MVSRWLLILVFCKVAPLFLASKPGIFTLCGFTSRILQLGDSGIRPKQIKLFQAFCPGQLQGWSAVVLWHAGWAPGSRSPARQCFKLRSDRSASTCRPFRVLSSWELDERKEQSFCPQNSREKDYIVDKCQSNVIHIWVVKAGCLVSLLCTVAPKCIWTQIMLTKTKTINHFWNLNQNKCLKNNISASCQINIFKFN